MIFDHSMHDNLFISFSAGTDSSLLLYLACTHLSDKRIVCHTGTDTSKDPFVGDYATDIIIWMRKQFPHLEIAHEHYVFNSRDLEHIEVARKEVEEAESIGEGWKYPTVYGHANSSCSKRFKKRN